MAAPKLDTRSINDVLKTAEALAQGIPPLTAGYVEDWMGVTNAQDPGRRAMALFSRLMELLIERENRIPEKNFLRFLDFVGVEPFPGSPAQAPITFLLAKDAAVGAIVPAGSQAATTQSESVNAQLFETESEFFATAARLEAVITAVPAVNGYAELDLGEQPPDPDWLADVSRAVVAQSDSDAELTQVPHVLYLSGDALFGRDETVDVTLIFAIAEGDADVLSTANITWKRFDSESESWVPLDASDLSITPGEVRVQLQGLAGLEESEVAGFEGRFVAAELDLTVFPTTSLPEISSVTGVLEVVAGVPASTPDFAFANALPLDLSKPFRPFGERPRYGDAFYVGSLTAFSPEVERVALRSTILPYTTSELVTMFTGIAGPTSIVTLVEWQYLRSDGGWESIATFQHEIDATAGAAVGISKTTLISSGAANTTVREGSPTLFGDPAIDGANGVDFDLTLGSDIGFLEVNGEEAYWIRAILRSKDPYGSDGFVISGAAAVPPVFVGPLYVPPTVESLEVVHTHRSDPIVPTRVIATNNFEAIDHTEANDSGASFPPFVILEDHLVDGVAGVFAPEPALYLALDRTLDTEFISLYVQLDEATSQAVTPLESGNPQLSWEYYAGSSKWKPMDVEDGTVDLTTSGTVAFLAASDAAPLELFSSLLPGQPSEREPGFFWMRARLVSGSYDRPPRVLGVYLNTVMSLNTTTLSDDLLIGSGNGKPGQEIQLVKFPVLGGDLWVREPERPSEGALEQLRDDILEQLHLEDPQVELSVEELIDQTDPADEGQDAIWIRWHRVPNFAASDELSRHYTLDPVRGLIGFGDSERGLIPPIARDNLALRDFQSGGGTAGRVAATALAIKELKTSLPFVSKVFNTARATGGSDAWSREDVMRFGPQSIKNRGRAVTTEDYEWMIRERFGQAVTVRCLPTRAPGADGQLVFRPGAVTVIVVPDSEETLPQPSNGLLSEIRGFLQKRTLGCILSEVHVIGPTYQPISIVSDVKALSSREASVVQRRVTSALEAWLHPITGGEAGTGWTFGRDVYLSEVFAVVGAVRGVDYVTMADFVDSPGSDTIEVGVNILTASGTHQIEVT